MVRTCSYKFSVIRFSPDSIRGESLNIAVVVLHEEGIDVRVTRRLEKVRAISGALDFESLNALLSNFKDLDRITREEGLNDPVDRLARLSNIGPLKLSEAGSFVANSTEAYEARIAAILRMLVEPEPAKIVAKPKKTKLLSEIKNAFKREYVLARPDEGLESHRIVSRLPLADGLTADMVLKNGSYHVIETVDASGDEHALRKAVSEIAVSALVLERARMEFAEFETKARLVFAASAVLERVARPALDAAEHQGAELVNWASAADRNRFVHLISSLATPIEPKRKIRFVGRGDGGLFH